MNKIKALDMELKDFNTYMNLRACDGNQSYILMISFLKVMDSLPRGSYRKKNKWFRKKIKNGYIFDTDQYPNMWIDIETGEIGGLENV